METANQELSSLLPYRAQESPALRSDYAWQGLFKIAGWAAMVATVLFLSTVILALAAGRPEPTSVTEWFTLLNEDRAAGIAFMALTDLVGALLLIPVVLALYAALRHINSAFATLAIILACVSLAVTLGTNSSYSLLYLSDQYAAATTELQGSQILAAGEAALAAGKWSMGALAAGFLFEGALIMFSALMLRGSTFGKRTAYLGLAAHGLDFAHSIALFILLPLFSMETASAAATILLMLGGTLQIIWYPLVA